MGATEARPDSERIFRDALASFLVSREEFEQIPQPIATAPSYVAAAFPGPDRRISASFHGSG